jgi:hypothetical protein
MTPTQILRNKKEELNFVSPRIAALYIYYMIRADLWVYDGQIIDWFDINSMLINRQLKTLKKCTVNGEKAVKFDIIID